MRYILNFRESVGLFLIIVLVAPVGFAAYTGASDPTVNPPNDQSRILQASVLVLETTDTTNNIQQALTNIGVPFALITSDDWTGIDFSPYDIVIVGMDGGLVSQASVQAIRTGVVDAGKRACFVGGSAWEDFVIGMNTSLIGIDTGNYAWAVSTTPHVTVTDSAHFLAQGLPPSINFVGSSAPFYMARLTDADMDVAAVNGDGYPCLVSKIDNFPGGGTGEFMWFINSSADYWTDPGDFAFFEQVVVNFTSAPPLFADGFESGDTSIWSNTVGLVLPATCAELWTDQNMWGLAAAGIDLRPRTGSTLHWIGCPTDGCEPGEFYCVDDAATETLTFGTVSSSSLRALVDPGNAGGDTMPTSYSDCATGATPMDISNAPDSNCNGSGINCIDALCRALGYQGGTILREVDGNICPEPHTLNASGTDWTSDFAPSAGWGAEYQCSGFVN